MPAAALHRLFYRSRATPETAADLDFVVGQIVGTSVDRNRPVGLTGLLLVVKDHFIQALEGDVNEVRTTYARISLDRRHQDLHIISQCGVQQRLFGEWNMCASALAPTDKSIVAVLGGKDFRPESLTPASTERLLVTVAAIQRRTAARLFV